MEGTSGSTSPHLPLVGLTLEHVRDRIIHLMEEGRAGQYEMGRLYNYVVNCQLARSNGFWTVRDCVERRIKVLSQSTLSMYGTVARRFSAEACRQYGVYRLFALARYMDTVRRWVRDSEDPGAFPVDVPEPDGSVRTRPFSGCRVEDLEAATNYQRYPGLRVPAEDASRVQRLQRILRGCFQWGPRVQVSVRVDFCRTLVSFKDVPLAELEKLVEVLREDVASVPRVAAASSGSKGALSAPGGCSA